MNDRSLPFRVVVGGRGGETRTVVPVAGAGRDEASIAAVDEFLRSTPFGARRYRIRATEYHVPLAARTILASLLAESGVLPDGVLHTKRESVWTDPAPVEPKAGGA